jgi:hypothetical protein
METRTPILIEEVDRATRFAYSTLNKVCSIRRVAVTFTACAMLLATAFPAKAGGQYSQFALQVATALHQTDSSWELLVGPGRYVWGIKKYGTASGTTEIHMLNPSTGYRTFSLQTRTALPQTGDNWKFLVANNGDVFAIKKNNTETRSTEVYILSGASNYQQISFQGGTALHETDATWDFALGLNRDIYAIKKSNTASGYTELHILNAVSRYRGFTGHFVTALHPTDATWAFAISPLADLFAIKKSGTGTGTTEVHLLSGERQKHRYKYWLLQTGTALHQTDSTWEFGVTPDGDARYQDVYAFKKSNTASGRTEIHVLRRCIPPNFFVTCNIYSGVPVYGASSMSAMKVTWTP